MLVVVWKDNSILLSKIYGLYGHMDAKKSQLNGLESIRRDDACA